MAYMERLFALMKAKYCKARFIAFGALLLLGLMPLNAMAQACTNPNGNLGDMIYNNTHEAFQGCTQRGWLAFHSLYSADPCTTTSTPGTACIDGTVYAGTYGGNRLYTTTTNQASVISWKTVPSVDDMAVDSLDDGLANSNQIPHNTDFPAFKACKDIGPGWYLPAVNELAFLFTNRVAIGGFGSSTYWSSSENSSSMAWYYSFNAFSPTSVTAGKGAGHNVRCVRR